MSEALREPARIGNHTGERGTDGIAQPLQGRKGGRGDVALGGRGGFDDAAAGERPEDAESTALKERAEEDERHGTGRYRIGKTGNAGGDHDGAADDDCRLAAGRRIGDQDGKDRPCHRLAGNDETDLERGKSMQRRQQQRSIKGERAGRNR